MNKDKEQINLEANKIFTKTLTRYYLGALAVLIIGCGACYGFSKAVSVSMFEMGIPLVIIAGIALITAIVGIPLSKKAKEEYIKKED